MNVDCCVHSSVLTSQASEILRKRKFLNMLCLHLLTFALLKKVYFKEWAFFAPRISVAKVDRDVAVRG